MEISLMDLIVRKKVHGIALSLRVKTKWSRFRYLPFA